MRSEPAAVTAYPDLTETPGQRPAMGLPVEESIKNMGGNDFQVKHESALKHPESLLEPIAYGAWNGGTAVSNAVFENKGMFFKGGRPVDGDAIEDRIGVRTRIAAPEGERIGVTALKDLLETSRIDTSRIKLVIGATNVGDDKYDPGPLIRHPFGLLRGLSPDAVALDLYAGCPGFNVATELVFMLSSAGGLHEGDISIVVAAENVHRARTFKPRDTSSIIFGDDALAAALETKASLRPRGHYTRIRGDGLASESDLPLSVARAVFALNGRNRIDGLIIDNQLGKFQYKVPATAARAQHRLVELIHPREAAAGTFSTFKGALGFYDRDVRSFAFDIMTSDKEGRLVESLARAYVESGKFESVASVHLAPDLRMKITLHRGTGYVSPRPRHGIVDVLTRTHGCFADYIEAFPENGDVFARIDGKGVFLHATRGARHHIFELLGRNGLAFSDIQLLIEHQANFAMIPMTLEKLFNGTLPERRQATADFLANRMVTNIHERGNCSVVCMLRLPYDLGRGALAEDIIQGYRVNGNLENLKSARIILSDSVGTGMTRSSVLQIRKP
jgi:3-oxoacyl-[acyl-carrier-protein] synthase III